MSIRITWIGYAPSLAEAEEQADAVNDTRTLFNAAVTSTTVATAATVLGSHCLLVCGPEYNIENAIEHIPDAWRSVWANSREGDDAAADTWLPDWVVAAYLLGKM